MKSKEYEIFISKFSKLAGETEKGVYYIINVNPFARKGDTDRNISITEHRLETGHGKNRDKTWCVEENTIFLNEDDIQKILKAIKSKNV